MKRASKAEIRKRLFGDARGKHPRKNRKRKHLTPDQWASLMGRREIDDSDWPCEDPDCPMLETIPHAGSRTTKHTRWYQEWPGRLTGVEHWFLQMRTHPCQNHPGMVRWLIERYAPKRGMAIHDPMAGAGTTMWEALRLQRRFKLTGWDIRQVYREWWVKGWAVSVPQYELDLILTSPEYFGTNHHPGATPRQSWIFRQANSYQGSGHICEPDEPYQDVGAVPTRGDHLQVVMDCYRPLIPLLKKSGHFVVIIRDRVWQKRRTRYPQDMSVAIQKELGLECIGAHPRRIRPSMWWQAREIKNPGQDPILVEWAYVFRRK